MKIAIIGAGFTGLTSAYELIKQGHDVTIFEKDSNPGGLAIGYKEKNWEWSLEKHYHHFFTNDYSILNLAKKINHLIITKTPETNWYVNGKIYKFVSLKAALTFPLLTLTEKFRQLTVLGLFRINPFWKPLERFKTNEIMEKLMGKKIYNMLWKSILVNKFGKYANDISLAWFWARIKKRTQTLSYPEGGFLKLAISIANEIRTKGGKIYFNHETTDIEQINNHVIIKINNKNEIFTFDKAIVTLPSFLFTKITPKLPQNYVEKLKALKSLGATNLILRLNKPFFKDNTYWLSVADTNSPIMAIVEHTNFMNKKYYNNESIVYLGNYLENSATDFSKNKDELLNKYDPFLKKINPNYKNNLIGYELFKAPFAQPIIPINYRKIMPDFKTPFSRIYLANIEQVYPWDRGTNYAVELGQKIAKIVIKN